MKTYSITLTDNEAEIIEAAASERGITPSDLLLSTVASVLQGAVEDRSGTSVDGETAVRNDLWFIGLFTEENSLSYAPEEEPAVREQMSRAIWEDSFGGTRAWTELDTGSIERNAEDQGSDTPR